MIAVIAGIFKWVFAADVAVTEYTAANAAGNVIVPDVEFTVTLPHCINNPLGNLVYPGFATDDAPIVKLFVANTTEFVTVKTLATVKLALTVAFAYKFATPFAMKFPFAKNVAVLVVIADELTVIVLTVEFALTLSVPLVLTTIDAELTLPVINVKSVEPLAVFTVVVVKLDIIQFFLKPNLLVVDFL